MFDFFRQFSKQATAVFNKLDPKQKLVVFFVSLFSVLVIVYLMAWTGERQWEVLFSNLEAEDAQNIIDQLEEEGISYRLETEGTAIMVPQGQEFELRLKMQAEGLITGGVVGYEIFDSPGLGMTDFLQQVNNKRALEGELSKTIKVLDPVDDARVLIVIPKTSLFVQDQKPATASVVLTLQGGTSLSSEQINTIANLVARAVEGLDPANVTISDSEGIDLSKVINKDPLIALRSEQLKIQRSQEIEIQNKLEALLTDLVGPTNYNIVVAVEMDFTQASSTRRSYDPTPTPVRSEERESSSGGVADTIGTGASAERSTTNFELNETVTTSVLEFGSIKKLSVAVTVNGTTDQQGNYTDRTPAEINNIQQSVQAAIGYDGNRGDVVNVVAYQFDITADLNEQQRIRDQQRTDLIQRILKWVTITVAAFAFIFVLRSVFRSLDLLLPKPKPKPAIDIEAEAIEEEISAEAQRRAQMLDQVSKFTREKPSNVAGLLNTWLIEEK